MNLKKEKKDDQPAKWLRLSQIGIQMGAIIGLSALGGLALDRWMMNETPWFAAGLSLFGVFAALYWVLKEVQDLNS
jgi:predicted MFS family arabinose efflux permease